MIKYIISTADIHMPNFHGIESLNDVLATFINQCKEIVDKEGKDCVRIVVAGDIFNNKTTVSNESIIQVNNFLKEIDNVCKTYVIAGNHDMLMNNLDRIDSLTPIFEIGELKNTVYLDRELGYKSGIYEDDNVEFCLYSSFSNFDSPFVGVRKKKNKTYVGLIHGDINGAVSATKHVTENGLDPNLFEKCDFVIAGHIHKFQEIKKNGVKIVYCSSLKQQDFGETVTEHGFVLWDLTDTDNYTYEYVETPNEEHCFYKFSINNIEDIENDEEEMLNY